jgi:hypothetical protein
LQASLAFSDAGLVLGAGTILAPMQRDGAGVETLDLSGEDRILAALAATFLAPVEVALLAKLRHASDLWSRGEKSLAQIYLTQLSLPRIDEAQAFQLFLADRLMASGFSPRELCKQLGFDLPRGLNKYSPDQPRDSDGKWTNGAGGAGGGANRSEVAIRSVDMPSAQTARPVGATDFASTLGLNPARYSYDVSGDAPSQTATNPDATSVVSTWTLGGSGLTQTDQVRLANGDIVATSVTDPKATQTLSLSDAGVKAGLVIAQPPGGDPTLIPATASLTGTILLREAGPALIHIGRWFATAAATGALAPLFYFGMTSAAGPNDEATPVGEGDQFRILSNPDTPIARVQRKASDGWIKTGLTVRDHEVTTDGSAAAAQHLRDLATTVAAIPDIGPGPLRADTPIPDIFKNADPALLRELNFDSYVQAGATGREADGSIGLLALSVRGGSWAAADERPVIGRLSQEETDAACPAYPKVQAVTSLSDAKIRAQNPDASPQQVGNLVHQEVEAFFKGQPGFKTNAGLLDGVLLRNGLRLPGSSFLDVLHDVGNGTICIFDVKTGISGLGSKQINQYWNEAKRAFGYAQRIYILEVRP